MSKGTLSFTWRYIKLPLIRFIFWLKMRPVKKASKLRAFCVSGLKMRVRNIGEYNVAGFDKNRDDLLVFLVGKLLFIETDYGKLEDRADEDQREVYSMIELVAGDQKCLQIIDLIHFVDTWIKEQMDSPQEWENRFLPEDRIIEEFDPSKKRKFKRTLKELINEDLEMVKYRSSVKFDFKFDDIKILFSVFTPIFLIGGYIYNRIYYGFFGIDVRDYFTITDYIGSSQIAIEAGIQVLFFAGVGLLFRLVDFSRNREFYTEKVLGNEKRIGNIIFYLFLLIVPIYYYFIEEMNYSLLFLVGFFLIIKFSMFLANSYFVDTKKFYFILLFSFSFFLKILILPFENKYLLTTYWKSSVSLIKFDQSKYPNIPLNSIVIGNNSNYTFLSSDSTFSNTFVVKRNEFFISEEINDKNSRSLFSFFR